MFEFFELPPWAMLWCSVLVTVTLLAQWGFVLIANALEEAEKRVAQLEVQLEEEREYRRSLQQGR